MEAVSDPSPAQLEDFEAVRTQHEGAITPSWIEQTEVEQDIFLIRCSRPSDEPITLYRERHITWLLRNLRILPRGYDPFDSLQGWVAFWILHALDLLGATVPEDVEKSLIKHLSKFKDPDSGGYGGGPGQAGHMASTFSVVMALCALGSDEALESIDKPSLSQFILSMKQTDGSYKVSQYGEIDVRATYCAIAIASMLGLLENETGEQYKQNTPEYIGRLQAFDGGLGGEPGNEAHGGNTYCGLATLVILERLDAIDAEGLLDWAVMRQMNFEGGFQGRTNKLVDSCYSFWVGSLFPLLSTKPGVSKETAKLHDANAVQKYIMECCQFESGGLRDKPGAPRDLMHACYALSGLSVAQHYCGGSYNLENRVRRTNPVYNLCIDKFNHAWEFFRRK